MVGVVCRRAIQYPTWVADEDEAAEVLHVLQEASLYLASSQEAILACDLKADWPTS